MSDDKTENRSQKIERLLEELNKSVKDFSESFEKGEMKVPIIKKTDG